jgi:hypothetical protein
MAVPICTTGSTITCPHGGRVVLTTSNAQMRIQGTPALLATDVHTVVGCPFTVGAKYSPCMTVRWAVGAQQAKVARTPVLLQTSVGICSSAEQASQGVAVISQTQSVAKGV